ncbi:hypothetical protein B9Z55_011593 [Caenorhabditis nigoni]|uniref:Uncharacterized protein n=1 Tax=Caenorhabditis nigoni TaxID=1611254 RepID=A0A2G5UL15_9PELO|nr:hypothetical protein B9Z55_011593 [Caenorhabditis nigoni]
MPNYSGQAKADWDLIHSSISNQWEQFTKSDFGKQVEQVLLQVHAWIKYGQKTFGPALQGFKTVFQFVLDILRNIAS